MRGTGILFFTLLLTGSAWGDGTVRIRETPQVSQPPPFSSGGRTVIVPRTRITIDGNTRKARRRLARAVRISGPARILGGDRLRIEGREIRLYGIDATEPGQICRAEGVKYPCGAMATARLVELTLGREIRCEGRDRARDGELLAVCFADKADLGARLMAAGWAMALRRETTRYAAAEDRARKNKKGLWRGTFVRPWIWRIKHGGGG